MNTRKPAMGFIFLTLILDVLGFGLLIPVGPRLVQELQGTGEANAAHAVGWLAASYALCQFIFAPFLGMLSDRFGRRRVLLVSLFGSGLDYFAMAFAPSLAWLFITRAINGISGASMTAASAYIADVTPPEKRAAGFGLIGAAFGLGFILGPVIGGFLGSPETHIPFIGPGDTRYPFYAAGTITLLNWLYGYFILPESLAPQNRRPIQLSRALPGGMISTLAKYPFVGRMAMAMFLLNMAQFALHSTWALYTAHRYHWAPHDVGLSLFAVGVGAAVVQAGLARRVIPILGERRSLLIGIAIGTCAYVGYGLASEGWMIFAIIAFASLGGIGMPAGQSMMSRSVRVDEQGTVQGANMSLQNLANIAGPLIGTRVYAWSIQSPEGTPPPIPLGSSFFVSGLLSVVGLLIAWWACQWSPPEGTQVIKVDPPPDADTVPESSLTDKAGR